MLVKNILPAVVALDAAGALFGAATSTIAQYGATGSVNVKSVLISTGIGAVVASIGVVGKVAKWIKALW